MKGGSFLLLAAVNVVGWSLILWHLAGGSAPV